jgi:hypothetical protein
MLVVNTQLLELHEQALGFCGFSYHLGQMVCGRFAEFGLEELNFLRFIQRATRPSRLASRSQTPASRPDAAVW